MFSRLWKEGSEGRPEVDAVERHPIAGASDADDRIDSEVELNEETPLVSDSRQLADDIEQIESETICRGMEIR